MKTILTIIFIIGTLNTFSQVGISTETPNSAAELDVVSINSNTGVLIPVLTNAEINTYSTQADNSLRPTHGMLIYNSDKNCFMYNAGTQVSPLWSMVGSIPVIDNIANLTGHEIEGDVRYCATNNLIYFYNGAEWKYLMP